MLVCLATLPAWASEAPTQPSLSPDETTELEAGGIIVHTQRGDINRGEVVGLVCAPMSELQAIVTDFNNLHVWYPDMLDSTVVSAGVGRGQTDMPWPISNRNWEIAVTRGTQTVGGIESWVATFDYIDGSGNLEEMYGYWMLRQYNDQCVMLRYVLNADLGIALPNSIVSWAASRMLPGIVEGLRERWDELY